MDDELAIRVDAHLAIELEADHEHGNGELVPMIEQRDRAEYPMGAESARVYYRCPSCGVTVSVRAQANAKEGPQVRLGAAE
jgi:hypothetical protein